LQTDEWKKLISSANALKVAVTFQPLTQKPMTGTGREESACLQRNCQ